jgi:tellurite resistance protein
MLLVEIRLRQGWISFNTENMKKDIPFYRRTPPALFPCLLGSIGLALLWQKMPEFGAPLWIGEALGAIVLGLFGFTFVCYAIKLILRPSVVLDDLKIGPARGAVSAGSVCLMLLAALILPYDFRVAAVVWWSGLILQVVYLICVVITLKSVENMRATLTPVLLLPFVGFIVAAIAGPDLGYRCMSITILALAAPLYIWIAIESLLNAKTRGAEPPNRAGFAILLAPPSVYAVASYFIWNDAVFYWFWLVALIAGIALVPFIPWMVRGGFKPSWGAFTFPLTAFSTAMMLGVQAGFVMAVVPMAIGVGLASVLVPYVVFKTFSAWGLGKLTEATKAAVA